jgi:hypothetical protein
LQQGDRGVSGHVVGLGLERWSRGGPTHYGGLHAGRFGTAIIVSFLKLLENLTASYFRVGRGARDGSHRNRGQFFRRRLLDRQYGLLERIQNGVAIPG